MLACLDNSESLLEDGAVSPGGGHLRGAGEGAEQGGDGRQAALRGLHGGQPRPPPLQAPQLREREIRGG